MEITDLRNNNQYQTIRSDLSAENELEDPHDEDPGDAHEEGEDGGQEEAPPLPLLQTLLHRGLIVKLKMF